MDWALVLSALTLGMAGTPHCAAMCGAACGALVRRGDMPAFAAFHAARIASYALAGAVAASSVGALSAWSQVTPAIRPLWTLAHVAAFSLGIWLMVRGRQPAWLERVGRSTRAATPAASGWARLQGPVRAGAAGSLWVAWPCGLLQSALLVAALANGAVGGAAVMAAFGVASAAGLAAGPWLWWRLGGAAAGQTTVIWATRASGALLVAASGWALGHGLWHQIAAYCGL